MKKLVLPGALLLCSFCHAQTDVTRYVNSIHARELKEKLEVLASPAMEGRETATEGERKAAVFIEERFRQIGLSPANNGSYRQYWTLYQDSLASAAMTVYGAQFALDRHFALSPGFVNTGTVQVSEVVFAGFGMVDSATNDYQDIDVKDRWVIIVEGHPADIDKTSALRWIGPAGTQSKIAAARLRGAKGVLMVTRNFPSRSSSLGKSGLYTRRNNGNFIVANISYRAAASILTVGLKSFKDLLVVKPGIYKTDLKLQVNKETLTLNSSNIVGLLEGSDKKDEYLVITAHYDHLGMRDGAIYHGADDDGSGTASVIEIAEAFAQAKKEALAPRRSILFMAVSGEEKGLLGSDFYANNPLFPLGKTTVNLNIDMVGRIDPKYQGDSLNYVYVIGDDKLSSDLRPITDSANQYFKMELDRRYTDVSDPNRFYYRSDHYNFAKNGVPIIFYFNGTHADYHKPSDTVDKINFPLMEKRVRFIFHTAWLIAQRESMLKRDLELKVPNR